MGHSYGALCALEAALRARNIRKLVLYDSGIEVADEEMYPHEVIERLEALRESRIVIMLGQGQAAMDTGKDLFKTEVISFLEGS